jgi:pyruvate dehydrogenase kinase 2/3/4
MNRVFHKIFSYKNIKTTPISLGYFVKKPVNILYPQDISNKIKSELEVRLAQRVIKLSSFPNYLREFKEVLDVKQLYVNSFKEINNFNNIKYTEDFAKFGNLLEKIKDRHQNVPLSISEAVQEYKKISNEKPEVLNKVLDEFYHSRVGIRTLIDYYNFLFTKKKYKNYLRCDIREAIECAAADAQTASYQFYKDHSKIPGIKIYIKDDPIIPYTQGNLHFIAFEILKNGMRAMIENDINKPLEVNVIDTTDYFIFVFRDYGPSVRHTEVDKLFDYSFTSVGDDEKHKKKLLAGFGHGLPLSRLYARFFGGNLIFIPYYGIKSEVIFYLNKSVATFETEI